MTQAVGWRSKPVLAAAISATGVGLLGMLTTDLSTWYFNLRKPEWQPPDWLFGPVWTTIFALAAIAGVLYWKNVADREARLRVQLAFFANAFLNTLWSLLFFRLKRPDLALYEVGFLWVSIVVLIVLLRGGSRSAAWLIAPYLAWVSFAAFLNLTIVQLNAPFT
jgi:tryptophan-rich sensory protein